MKFIKSNSKLFLGILIGILISGISVYAVTRINANEIEYDSTHTVKDKIDDLYTTQNTTVANLNSTISDLNTQLNAPLDINLRTEAFSKSYQSITNYRNASHNSSWLGKYSKIKYVSVETNDYTALCKVTIVKKDGSSMELSVGTVVNAADYSNIYVTTKSTTDNKGSACVPLIRFYN